MRKGIKKKEKKIITENKRDYVKIWFKGSEFLDNENNIKKREKIEINKIKQERNWKIFWHILYPSYSTQNSGVSSSSPDSNKLWFSIPIAWSR